MTDTSYIWRAYATQLKQALGSGGFDPATQQFSIATSTLQVGLGNPDPEIALDYVYQMGNTVPKAGLGYAPGGDLNTAYLTFLNSIAYQGDPNPNLKSQLNVAANNLNTAQGNYTKVLSSAESAWQEYKAMAPSISLPDYIDSQYPTYGAAYNALLAAQSDYDQLMAQAEGPGYQEIALARQKAGPEGAASMTVKNDFNMQVKTGLTASSGSRSTLPGATPLPSSPSELSQLLEPLYSIQGFTEKYQEWQTASTRNEKAGHTISIDSASSYDSEQEFGWSSIGGDFRDFFDFFIDASGSDTHKNTKIVDTGSSAFSFECHFLGLTAFNIGPVGWFDESLVQEYKDKLVSNAPDLFGAVHGSMGRMPYQAILGFQPTITLRLANENYQSYKHTSTQTSVSGMMIGPFMIGGGVHAHYSQKDMEFHDSANTIVINPPKSTEPLLLGVISTPLG